MLSTINDWTNVLFKILEKWFFFSGVNFCPNQKKQKQNKNKQTNKQQNKNKQNPKTNKQTNKQKINKQNKQVYTKYI